MPYSGQTHYILGWVTSGQQNPILGILPAASYVVRASLHVTVAFDSDGTDNIQCGYDADNDSIFTNTLVNTTGIKTVTLGAEAGYNGTARSIEAYYTNSGSEPTVGKAIVVIEFFLVPTSP